MDLVSVPSGKSFAAFSYGEFGLEFEHGLDTIGSRGFVCSYGPIGFDNVSDFRFRCRRRPILGGDDRREGVGGMAGHVGVDV